MIEETNICRLCLEPVSNFICADCLFHDVDRWLVLKQHMELFPRILTKHENIKSLIQVDANGGYCVKCKKNIGSVACPCCYLYEMYSVIKETNQELANNFERNFNFDFSMHHSYSQLTFWQSLHQEPVSSKTFKPIILSEKRNFAGIEICDNCGQVSGEISDLNGSFVCESCLEEHNLEIFRPFSIDFQ